MALLTVNNVLITGVLDPTFAAANGGGDTFPNDGTKTFVYIKNGDGTTTDVTFDDTGSVTPVGAEAFDADVLVQLAATTGEALIGPFRLARFGTTVAITYEKVTSLTIAVFKMP